MQLSLCRSSCELSFESKKSFVMFIGHPRSSHSLVGSILDAHPNAIIANELDILTFLRQRERRGRAVNDRNTLFRALVDNSKRAALGMRMQAGYSYAVPDAWQGRWEVGNEQREPVDS